LDPLNILYYKDRQLYLLPMISKEEA